MSELLWSDFQNEMVPVGKCSEDFWLYAKMYSAILNEIKSLNLYGLLLDIIVDLDSLSDEKLARVREYVRQHTSRNENVSDVSSSNRNCGAQSAHHSKQLTKVNFIDYF